MCRAVRNNKTCSSAARPIAGSGQFLNCILFALLTAAALPTHGQTLSSAQEYQYVIEQARNGRHDWALDWLARQGQLQPDNQRIKHDQLIIAGWAGRYQNVIDIHQALPPQALPLPRAALAAVARAYRDARQWPMALSLYREGKRRFPDDRAFSLGETLVLADSGDTSQALVNAQTMVKLRPRDAHSYLVKSYAYRLNNEPYAALEAATKAYTIAPDSPDVVDEYLHALTMAGLADAALRTAQAHSSQISPERMYSLEADRAAELTRLASRPSRQEKDRFSVADRALDAYQELAASKPPAPQDLPGQVPRARIDRLIALHARARTDEVVSEYEALKAQGVVVPSYALGHVASAYLDQRQPEKAADLYLEILNAERAIQVDPAVRLSHQSGLFYSLVESEQFDQAKNVMSVALQEQPAWLRQKGTPLPQPNDLNLAANQHAALAYHYADDPAKAQEMLEHLVAQAPGHSGLRSALAEVYLARGWPRRAERELKLAETSAPRALDVVAEQGKAAMALREWRQAETLIESIAYKHPEDAQVRRLVRDWDRHNRAELRVSGQVGLASDSPVAGDGDLRLDTVLYTAPIGYNWRGFAGGGYATAEFEDVEADYHWYRVGAEWRGRNLTAELEASSNHYGHGAKVGVRALVAYDLNDEWQVGGQASFRTREVPLKALANNITANRLDAYVNWRQSERREWRLTFSPTKFSDGNRRLEFAVSGRERLYTAPHLKLDALVDIGASHNTHAETPYFNPRADLTVLPALALTHTLYRRYDTVLEHRFMVGAGLYAQRGYGSGAIAAVGYGLRYRHDEMFDAGISITGVSRPYDGQREREARVMFDLQIRF